MYWLKRRTNALPAAAPREIQPGLESELRRHLGTVPAPENLWRSIDLERHARTRRSVRGLILWPALVTVMVLSCANLGWQVSRSAQPAASPEPAPKLATLRRPEAKRGDCISCHVQGL